MPLERLVEEIRERNAHDIAEETKRAEAEKARIDQDRAQRIRKIEEEIAQHSAIDIQRERVQRLAAAKLASRKGIFEAKENRGRQTLMEVQRRLAEFTQSDEYAALLRRMYAFAASELGTDLRVSGRREDAALLRSVARKGFVAEPVATSGGLVAETPDGARRLNLTFEELLRQREDRVRALLKV